MPRPSLFRELPVRTVIQTASRAGRRCCTWCRTEQQVETFPHPKLFLRYQIRRHTILPIYWHSAALSNARGLCASSISARAIPIPWFFVENLKISVHTKEREPWHFVSSDLFWNSDDKNKASATIVWPRRPGVERYHNLIICIHRTNF
jgi:hypothetical protein